jgi:hypothetical protein
MAQVTIGEVLASPGQAAFRAINAKRIASIGKPSPVGRPLVPVN